MSAVRFFRRPLLPAALAFLAGTCAAFYLPDSHALRWAVIFITLVCGFVFIRHWPRRGWLVFVVGAAMLNVHVRSDSFDPDTLTKHLSRSREYVHLQVELVSDPIQLLGENGAVRAYRADARVLKLQRIAGWKTVRGQIRIQDRSGDLWMCGQGDTLDLRGRLDVGSERFLPYPLLGKLSLQESTLKIVKRANRFHFGAWCATQRERCASLLEEGLGADSDAVKILQAVLLGKREGIPSQWIQHFAATGTLHVFAISGLHVGLVALMLIGCLRLLGLGPHQWVWPLLPLLIFYTILTGAQPSAVRACLMAVTYWGALAFRRKPDAPSALALAALLMVGISPDQLFSVGFIFSFLVVGGLLLFCQKVYESLTEEASSADAPWHMSVGRRLKLNIENRMLLMIAVSTTAWVVSAPLTAYVFYRFTPVALLGNLVVAPAAFFMIFLGLGAIGFGHIHPVLAVPFNQLNGEMVGLLLGFIRRLSEFPFSNAYVSPPHLAWLLLVYATLLAPWLLPRKFRRKAMLCGAALLVLLSIPRWMPPPMVQVLPTTQGMALLVRGKGASHHLIDTGSRLDSWTLIRRLREEGIDSLDTLLITHPDVHHYGAMDELADAMPIGEVWVGPMKGSSTYRGKLAQLQAMEVKKEVVFKGWRSQWGEVQVEVLYPEEQVNTRKGDEGCLVVRVSRGRFSVLVLGDANRVAQRALLEQGTHPGADVLVVTGSGGELDPVFLAWCRPQQVVFTGPMPSPTVWQNMLEKAGGIPAPELHSVFRVLDSHPIPFE